MSFLKELAASNQYHLFLLSNTNDLHISWIQNGLQDGIFINRKMVWLVHSLLRNMGEILELVIQSLNTQDSLSLLGMGITIHWSSSIFSRHVAATSESFMRVPVRPPLKLLTISTKPQLIASLGAQPSV